MMAKLNCDLMRDLIHFTNFAKVPGVLVVHPSVPARNAKELIALAKARPGELRHGSTGTGSPHHLAAEIFKAMDGIKRVHIPCKGATRAIQSPDIGDRMSAEGATFVGDTPEQFSAFISTEIVKWGKAVKASGAKPE